MKKERRKKRGRGEENRVSGFESQETGRRETVSCWRKGCFCPSFKTASEELRRLDSPGLPGLNSPLKGTQCKNECVSVYLFIISVFFVCTNMCAVRKNCVFFPQVSFSLVSMRECLVLISPHMCVYTCFIVLY